MLAMIRIRINLTDNITATVFYRNTFTDSPYVRKIEFNSKILNAEKVREIKN